jgi:uncharacterized protein with PIN domain
MDKNDEREIADLSKLQDDDIFCADCNEKIFKMVRVEESDFEFSVLVVCPFCEGESWRKDMKGKYYQDTVDGTIIKEVIADGNDFTIEVKKYDG